MRTLQRILLILALPLLGAIGGYGFGLAASEGRLERWRPLGTPPASVVSLEAHSNGVWAATAAGQWFMATENSACAPNCWAAASAPPVELPGAPLDDCVPLPRVGDAQASAARCGTGVDTTYLVVYVLRPDGGVWVWTHAAGAFGDDGLVGTGLGFSAGVGLMLLILLAGALYAASGHPRRAHPQTTPPLS